MQLAIVIHRCHRGVAPPHLIANSEGIAMVEVREETLLEISGLLSRSHPTVRSPFRLEAHYCGTIFRRICEQRTLSPCLKGLSLTC